MQAIQQVDRFIDAKTGVMHDIAAAFPQPGSAPFITISRQSGAGGRVLAEALLDALAANSAANPLLQDWRIFDRKMCETVLQDSRLADAMSKLLEEDYRTQIGEFILGLFGRQVSQNVVFPRLSQLLRTVATIGKVIIVGHSGFQATRGLSGAINMRVIAPQPVRIKRVATMLALSETKAARIINEHDEKRRQLLKTYFHADCDDPGLYDVVWNTNRMSPTFIAESMVTLIEQRYSGAGEQPAK